MPRKTFNEWRAREVLQFASMRPRPDAAENRRRRRYTRAPRRASMRPRPDAAENSYRAAHVDGLLWALQ